MTKISPLRQRFIDDMNLAGLTAGTQTTYIGIILKLVRHCGNTPPQSINGNRSNVPLQGSQEEHDAK